MFALHHRGYFALLCLFMPVFALTPMQGAIAMSTQDLNDSESSSSSSSSSDTDEDSGESYFAMLTASNASGKVLETVFVGFGVMLGDFYAYQREHAKVLRSPVTWTWKSRVASTKPQNVTEPLEPKALLPRPVMLHNLLLNQDLRVLYTEEEEKAKELAATSGAGNAGGFYNMAKAKRHFFPSHEMGELAEANKPALKLISAPSGQGRRYRIEKLSSKDGTCSSFCCSDKVAYALLYAILFVVVDIVLTCLVQLIRSIVKQTRAERNKANTIQAKA